MATVSLNQLLSSPVVTRAISLLKTPQSRLQNFFGCYPGGPNVNPVGGRTTAWDIFNRTRGIAQGRAPGTGPGTVKPQITGHVTATIYRAHEKIFLDDNKLHRQRPLGQNWGTIDERGERYVTRQEGHMAQRLKNSREFLLSRMLKGGFDLKLVGDDMIPVDYGNGDITINYQAPLTPVYNTGTFTLTTLAAYSVTLPGNTTASTPFSGVDDTKWDTASDTGVDIFKTCMAINSGAEALHGLPIRHAWCNSTVMNELFGDTGLKAMAGTANMVWERYERTKFLGPDGKQDTGFEIVFKALPWLTWHVYDGGLDVFNGTNYVYTKFFADEYVTFLPDVDNDWFELQEGSEIVRENVMDPGRVRYGMAAWSEIKTQPSGFELISLDNFIPALYLPSCPITVRVIGY